MNVEKALQEQIGNIDAEKEYNELKGKNFGPTMSDYLEIVKEGQKNVNKIYKTDKPLHPQQVGYKIASLLKEKGFDEPCDLYYPNASYDNKALSYNGNRNSTTMFKDEACSCPTQDLASRWLRERKGYHITIVVDVNDNHSFYTKIYRKGDECWERQNVFINRFETYEEAVEAGIRHILQNLL